AEQARPSTVSVGSIGSAEAASRGVGWRRGWCSGSVIPSSLGEDFGDVLPLLAVAREPLVHPALGAGAVALRRALVHEQREDFREALRRRAFHDFAPGRWILSATLATTQLTCAPLGSVIGIGK